MDPGPSTKLHAPSPRPPIQFPAEIHPVAPRPLHNSPVGRSSPLAPNGSAGTSSNGRRRVLSANPGPTMPGYPARSKRAVSSSFGPSAAPSHREAMSSVMEDSGISLFSDEYDLSHQDPQILQDVQRALKLKARREARLKSANSSPSSNKSEHASTSSPQSSPLRPVIPPVPFAPPLSPDIRETQSSPTPGQPAPPVAHPVPSSSDEGTTLDWSSIGADDDRLERRWTMSITKRKDKERSPSNNAVETRETMYAAKIQQMRKKISPAAQQQATLISDQLGRRYNILLNSPPSDGVNILKVARWFSNQDEVVKTSLEQAEPLSWLGDSEEEPKCPSRFPWYLSALIMEEYALQLHGNPKPRSYHERVASLNSSPNLSIISRPPFPSPHGSSYFPLGPSLKRKLSYEGRIYFEPREGRMSIESRKSGESGDSSISLPHALISPTSANFHPRVDSDIASSRNSLSEHSDDGGRKLRPIIHPAPLSRELLSNSTVKANPPLSPIPDDRPEKREGAVSVSSSDKISDNLPPTATNRTFGQRKVRISLPPKDDFRLQLERKRQEDAAEEQAIREYELKQHLLSATVEQNSRVRQLLNRVAATVKEYDQAQTSLSNLLHIPYNGLPRELAEAFSHDPAAVTGGTRSYKGWRAVDDIHQRLARQRETFQEFISCAATVDHSVIPESVLADPIASLTESLKSLDSERQEVAWRATEVLDVLMRVKNVHAEVKTAYNDTLSHTSVIYPEISTIVDLEESYKDQYQYLWELAMDALTFVLDTVTPFWRTYGRMIGDDVQHFLIIPLYRNEFTGEPKRYNIYTFPRRSFRHWVGLFLFFLATVALAVFQTRAALSSVSNRWLEGIPFVYLRRLLLIPFWVSIIIQWWAVVAELSVVLTQLAVVVWWMGCRISLLHVSCSGYYPGGGGAAAPGVGGKAGLGRIDWA